LIFLFLKYRDVATLPVLRGTRRQRENQNFPKNTCRAGVHGLALFVVKEKIKIFSKIIAGWMRTVWPYFKKTPIIPRPFACKGGGVRGGVVN